MNNIHKTAIIEEGFNLGDNITIGAFTIIGKDVKMVMEQFDSHSYCRENYYWKE